MSNIPLKTIKFPGLDDTYTVPVVDNTLATAGAAADAKKVGDELSDLKQDLTDIEIPGYNLFNTETIAENTFINDTGVESTSISYYCSDYISVSGNFVVSASADSAAFRICKYDSNKVFQSREWTENNPYTGNWTGYIRLLLQSSNHIGGSTDRNTVIVNAGNVLLPYQKYYSALDYMARYYGLMTSGTLPNNTNLNDILDNRLYELNSSYTYSNNPVSGAAFLLTMKATENHGFQFVLQSYSGELYYRRILNGSLSDWNKITHTKNSYYKIAMFGDSITWGRVGGQSADTQYSQNIPWWVEQQTKMPATNYGIGGMGWLSTQYYSQNALNYVQSVNLSAFDYVSFAYGINDSDQSLGTYTDTEPTTIMGAMYSVLDYMKTNYPNKVFIIITPQLTADWASTYPEWSWNKRRTGGWTLKEMVEEMEKFCELYHVHCISSRKSPINSFTAQSLLGDGVHPNTKGYDLLGRYIAGQITAMVG